MKSVAELKEQREKLRGVEDRIKGILQPKADPYKELVRSERIREATYTVPEGLTEEEAMLLTAGAMVQDEITDIMLQGNGKGESARNFNAVYVFENIFAGAETEGRLGNAPIVLGQARENAARAFKNFENGNTTEVQEMGKALIKRLCKIIAGKMVTDSAYTVSYTLLAKKVLALVDNKQLGLELSDDERAHLQAYANTGEMQMQLLDAEIQMQEEELPAVNSLEREDLLKKVWLMHAMIKQNNAEVDALTSDAYAHWIQAIGNTGLNGAIMQIDIASKAVVDQLQLDIATQVVNPSQMVFSNQDNIQIAMDAYWEQMKKTDTYKILMETEDKEAFIALLENARETEKLPTIHAFDEAIAARKDKDEISITKAKSDFDTNFEKELPGMQQRVAAVERVKEVLAQMEREKASDRLAGSMTTIQEYVSIIEKMERPADTEPETYAAYVEEMKKVVEKTEALYEKKEDGTYVSLTKENLKELQECYKNAYVHAIELKKEAKLVKLELVDNIMALLEENISVLGTLDKKNLTNLPDAMTNARTVFLDVTGSQMEQVSGAQNARMHIQYTDVNGQKKNGYFTKRTEYRSVSGEFVNCIKKLNEKYPHMGDVGEQLLNCLKKNSQFRGYFDWQYNKLDNLEKLSAKNAKIAFMDKVIDNIGEEMGEDWCELLKDNKEEAAQYFLELVDETTKLLNKENLYTNQLGIPGTRNNRIDTRNIAMSAVAGLLGMPNIVAKATPMQLQDGNKKQVEGTFMEMAEGVDVYHLPKKHPMRNYNANVYNNAQGLKSLADIQILDYICLNIDRHPGNMLYQFDTTDPENPKFIGVQGIDNDVSFGTFVEDNEFDPRRPITQLENLGIISQSTYESLMEMSTDSLRACLKARQMGKDEIEAACSRLEKLKNKVLEDKEYFDNKGAEGALLEEGKIRIVSDEQFAQLTIDDVLKAAPEAKAFKNIRDNIRGGVPIADSKEREDMERQKENRNKLVYGKEKTKVSLDITEVNLSSKNYYTKIQRDLSKFLLETKSADSFWRGSSEKYKAVQTALKEAVELVSKVENPKKEEVDNVIKALHKVDHAVMEYKHYKKDNRSGSAYEQTHINLMLKIGNSMEGKLDALRTEMEKHFSRIADAENRQERIQERKYANKLQVQKFVSNLMDWSVQEPKENQQRALGAAIVMGSLAEHAMTYMEEGKRDKMFQMTKEQFDKQVTQLIESPKFNAYYKNLNQEQLQKAFAGSKQLDSYFEDFKNYNAALEANQQQQQPKHEQEKQVQQQVPELNMN